MDVRFFDNMYHTESPRLPEWDYAEPGSYFVTICTKSHKSFFGKVKDEKVMLNNLGEIIREEIYNIEAYGINIDVCVIMPNHLHIIMTVHEDHTVETSIYGVSGASHAMNPSLGASHAMNRVSTGIQWWITWNRASHAMNRVSTGIQWWITWNRNIMLNKRSIWYIIRWFKWKTSFLLRKKDSSFGWQANYYEHVIRDERDFARIATYIMNNPYKRKNDEYYQ